MPLELLPQQQHPTMSASPEALLPAEASGAAAELLDGASCSETEDLLFKSDEFRMHSMKVLACSKRYVHDWTECPFAHPAEKAKRRDPRIYNYTGIACPSMKKEGVCAFGDYCPYAHNVFEYWLHPTRYRTQLCNDGSNCKRKICFFAHSLDELRVPACKPFVSPEALAAAAASAAAEAESKRKAGTVGSPLLALAGGDPLAAAQYDLSDIRMSTGSDLGGSQNASAGPAPPSPITTSRGGTAGAAGRSSGPAGGGGAGSALSATLQQLQGGGFSNQEQQVIELVTTMLSQDKISAQQAASILQAMLPNSALSLLQSHLLAPNTPAGSDTPAAQLLQLQRGAAAAQYSSSDPLSAAAAGGGGGDSRAASFDGGAGRGLCSDPLGSSSGAIYSAMLAMQGGGQGLAGGLSPQVAAALGQAAPFPGASPRASVEYGRPSFDASSMRSSFDTMRGDSIDMSARPSMDYSRSASLEMYGSGANQLQAPAYYQQSSPQPQRGITSQLPTSQRGSMSQLAPVPEQHPAAQQPLPPASQALGQLAGARKSVDLAVPLPPASAPTPTQQQPQQPQLSMEQLHRQLQRQLEIQQIQQRQSFEALAAAAAAACDQQQGGGGYCGPARRHSADAAAQYHAAMQQAQQQRSSDNSRRSADAQLLIPQLPPMPEGLPYLVPQRSHMPAHWAQQAQQAQQYAAAAAAAAAVSPHQQYSQQYNDRAASMDATAEMLRMSSEFQRMSLEAERRASVDRRSAPQVVNAFSSSLFAAATPPAPAPGAAQLVAPTPARALSVPEGPVARLQAATASRSSSAPGESGPE